MSRSKKEGFHVTEGNIFEDLGLENSDELLARSKLPINRYLLQKQRQAAVYESGTKAPHSRGNCKIPMPRKIDDFESVCQPRSGRSPTSEHIL